MVSLDISGAFNAPLTVASGTTTAKGTLNGIVTVASGATLQVVAGPALSAYGNVIVDGALSGGDGTATLKFFGATFTNNGTVSLANVRFSRSGTQTIQGAAHGRAPASCASNSDPSCRWSTT